MSRAICLVQHGDAIDHARALGFENLSLVGQLLDCQQLFHQSRFAQTREVKRRWPRPQSQSLQELTHQRR